MPHADIEIMDTHSHVEPSSLCREVRRPDRGWSSDLFPACRHRGRLVVSSAGR